MLVDWVAGWRGMRNVAACLRDSLPPDATLHTQRSSEYLCTHEGKKAFQLRPDLMITQGEKRWVLDTKWKRFDSELGSKNYGLSQADFYQLFAYGQKYLGGQGDLAPEKRIPCQVPQ
ncbi:hypothetical protein A3SO_05850 [Pseudomonas syringae pv. actinidiae ICMP 19072]|nr:hypothetical protein A3SO_05850 [Pseudomonas syringae pv. actinidiae ICMP 19072]